MNQFFGKYRGKVIKNKDPLRLGRIRVRVPSVLGALSKNWAMPCVPYAGKKVGFYAIPPVGANVWVEFEGGNPNKPIWSGCFWGKGEVPAQPAVPEIKVFRTEGITLTLDNRKKKGFSIEVTDPVVKKPLKLVMNDDTITLNHSDERIVKITADTIELINKKKTIVKLTVNDIELIHKPVHIKLLSKGKKIELKNNSSRATLSSDKIEIKQGSGAIEISGSDGLNLNHQGSVGLELSSSSGATINSMSGKMEMSPQSIKIASKAVGEVEISAQGVNINNAALEVM
jgi:hypothetical protein